MLTRHNLLNGSLRDYMEKSYPTNLIWSEEEIAGSLDKMLANKPDDGPIWVFGHGSLIWGPRLAIEEIKKATLKGWYRSFCIRLTIGSASPKNPGRMLSLEEGEGEVGGMAFRLDDKGVRDELLGLWTREMILGSYEPQWLPITLSTGVRVFAIVFVTNQKSPCYEHDSSVKTVAQIIAGAQGVLGDNADYVFKLEETLCSFNINDPYVIKLADNLRELQINKQ